ncbi:MAG: hypothetical protein KIT31_32770 [Deltaproteobacteria bacterium]|nr:hypothetical protein [Deltaproteobacteria bacterium]
MTEPKLVAHDAAATIAAGGIVALGAELPADQRASPVTARAYRHPALEHRIVVRIEPEAVSAGTDAEMAAFGFGEPEVSDELGEVRHRTLGFPAWALVHDPKKAKAALDVTEDMRKAKRLVASKPGHAKDAFEKIAKTLQRTAPQFLPSFWEEVGRAVADQASATMAAQCFERARQAERAYKLKIDPEDADAAFVEFALLGALSAKTLSQYAKDLAKSAGGKEAYRRFRAIIVKRALGGMPPYSGMGKDLSALAKAADLDLGAEEDALVSELIEAPGVGKAPVEFWTTYRDACLRLGKARVEMRNRMRAIWPDPRGGNDDTKQTFKAAWLELLHEIGALEDLPDDGLGAWVTRMIRYVGKTDRSVAVLRKEAPRLVALKQPIGVTVKSSGWGYDLSLDLAELALELGLELSAPGRWEDFDTDAITCDPVRVAAHPKYGEKLLEVTEKMMGSTNGEPRMRGKQGFVAARRQWITGKLDALAGTALSVTETLIENLKDKTTAPTFVEFPDLYARLQQVDVAAALAQQLRFGVADEFGWPAYEAAFAALGDDHKNISVGGAYPVLTAWNKTKCIALDATGVIAEHDLVYNAKDDRLEQVWYFGGEFLVLIRDYPRKAYWSSAPKEKFEISSYPTTYSGRTALSVALPDGSTTTGGKAFRPGDRELESAYDFLYDGTTIWLDHDNKLRALDPATGKQGEPEDPPFVKEFELDGWQVERGGFRLFPVPAGVTDSPLGHKDGLSGLRVRSKIVPKPTKRADDDEDDDDPDPPRERERIDGLRVPLDDQRNFDFYLTMPGSDELRGIDCDNTYGDWRYENDGPSVEVYGPPKQGKLYTANEDRWAAHGWGKVHLPPARFWAFLSPRDRAGSQALRDATRDQAQAVLEAARAEIEGREDDADELPQPLPETAKKVREVLGVRDDRLALGIAGVAGHAAGIANTLAEVIADRSKENASANAAGLSSEAASLRKVATALANGKPTKLKDVDADPREWLVNPRGRALLAMLALEDDDDRRKARDHARALGGTIFADDLSKLRVLELEAPDDYDSDDWSVVRIEVLEGSVFAVEHNSNWAIELSTDGVWRQPPPTSAGPWKIEKETKLSRGIGTAWAEAFAELPDAAMAWDPTLAAAVAARADLSLPEATLLAVGVPGGWGRDFLGKKKREVIGLKVSEADAARTTFEQLDDEHKVELFERAAPEDPSLIATPLAPGGFAELLGDAWKAKFGKRAKIPQDLVAAAKKELDLDDELGKLLPAFAGGHDDAWFLQADKRPLTELGGWRDDKGLTPDKARELLTLLSWLFYARPVGCAVRAGIPAIVEKVRAVVTDEEVLWKLDDMYINDEDKKDDVRARGIVDLVGGKPIKLPKDGDDECLDARDDGSVQVAYYKNEIKAGFHPAAADKGRKKIETVAKAMSDDEDSSSDPTRPVRLASLLQSDAFAAFGARVAETPVAEGGYEANPLVSVPRLVAKVGKELGVSDDAAALYLQTLALAEPTQQRVQLWNGWKPKQYATAAAELVKKKVVTEGKRERAGRSIFVRGGYTKGDRRNLPLEEWKLPFYGVLERHLPTEPAHLLFARAWKRVEDGDKPA